MGLLIGWGVAMSEAGPPILPTLPPMTLADELRAKIVTAEGNPDCLHCQLSAVIDGHMQATWGGKVHAMVVAAALSEIVGDLLSPAPKAAQPRLLGRIIGLIGERLGLTASVSFADDGRPAVDTPKVH